MPPSPRDPDYRPLLPLAPRLTSDGIELDLGSRVVAVSGPREQLAAVAALCDGRRPAAAIVAAVEGLDPDDLAELLAELTAAGAVVDTSEAWKVFHDWSGVDSGLGRPVAPEEIRSTLDARYEQPGAGKAVALSPDASTLDDLLSRRRSSAEDDPSRSVGFGELSKLLAAMYAGDGYSGRPVPSGGGLYTLAIHVLVRESVGSLEPGAWWYDPAANELRSVSDGVPAVEQAFVADPNTQARLARRQAVVVLSADVARGARKYASRAYRLALIEVGAVAQNAYLVATDLDVPIRAMLGLRDPEMSALLKLPNGTVPLLGLLVGQ